MDTLFRGAVRPCRLAALALTLLCGCSTMRTSMGRARTVSRGHLQAGVGIGASGKTSNPQSNVMGAYGAGALHYGVTDSVELGGRLDLAGGLLAEAKIQLLRSPTEESGIDLALAPHLSVASVMTSPGSFICGLSGSCPVIFQVSTLAVPLMVGVNLGDRNQLILAPRLALESANYSGAITRSLVAGASVSFAQYAGEGHWLVYDVSAEYPIASSFETSYFQTRYLHEVIRLQAQVGVLFGE